MRPSPSQMTMLASLSARVTGDSSSLCCKPQVPACRDEGGRRRHVESPCSGNYAFCLAPRPCRQATCSRGTGRLAVTSSPRTRTQRESLQRLSWRCQQRQNIQLVAKARCSTPCSAAALRSKFACREATCEGLEVVRNRKSGAATGQRHACWDSRRSGTSASGTVRCDSLHAHRACAQLIRLPTVPKPLWAG